VAAPDGADAGILVEITSDGAALAGGMLAPVGVVGAVPSTVRETTVGGGAGGGGPSAAVRSRVAGSGRAGEAKSSEGGFAGLATAWIGVTVVSGVAASIDGACSAMPSLR
jgi:hypothetical protein